MFVDDFLIASSQYTNFSPDAVQIIKQLTSSDCLEFFDMPESPARKLRRKENLEK
jgi:hypothetical protein